MRAEVITIGTELLLGEIDDTNATHIARALSEAGVDLFYRTTVGDNEARIAEAIDNALARVDVVITTGGLGPTIDDVTREAVARATNRELEYRQELFNQIAERFRRFNVQMSDNNRRQAYVPAGATAFENSVGTAPIFILETQRGAVIVLPGVPREMRHLLAEIVIPWLREQMDEPAVIRSLILRTAGVGESQVDARIADLMVSPNPTVGLAAHVAQTDVRITAKAATGDVADEMLNEMAAVVSERLGSWIYSTGDELLEDVVIGLLTASNARLAVSESGTHGLLAERLTEASARAGSDVLAPFVASDDAPTLNDIEANAQSTAEAIRQQQGVDYGMAVLMVREETPDTLPETGTGIAVSTTERTVVRTFNWLNDRPDAHVWATTHALALLRRLLLKQAATPGE